MGDNGVHGSASPLEGLAERLNWLGATLEDDATAQALIEAGVKRDTLLQWIKDPHNLMIFRSNSTLAHLTRRSRTGSKGAHN